MMKKIVACSGGPDSMALLDMLREAGNSLIVAHVNYHKRESADRDEQIVRFYCAKYELPCYVLSPVQNESDNFQAWARKVRYAFFADLAGRFGADEIVTAHHQDDHLETYLFQKQRSMLCDAYGLQETVLYCGISVVRPLLHKTKKELEAYCVEHRIPYGIDESNLSDRYTRNKIRHHSVETMDDAQRKELLTKIQVENEMLKKRRQQAEAFLDAWDRSVEAIKDPFVFEMFLHQKTGLHAGKKESEDLLKQLQSPCLIEWRDFELENHQGKVFIEKKTDPVCVLLDPPAYKAYNGFSLQKTGKTIEGFTVRPEDLPLCVRNVRPGDAIRLRTGTKKVSRFFIDRKISRILRKRWLVVENREKNIIFVPGIGCDIEHFSSKPTAFMIQLFPYLEGKEENDS